MTNNWYQYEQYCWKKNKDFEIKTNALYVSFARAGDTSTEPVKCNTTIAFQDTHITIVGWLLTTVSVVQKLMKHNAGQLLSISMMFRETWIVFCNSYLCNKIMPPGSRVEQLRKCWPPSSMHNWLCFLWMERVVLTPSPDDSMGAF